MAIRRIRAEASAKATSNTTDNTSAILRRAQPRDVAFAARKAYLKHTQRNVQDIESPVSPAIQDPARDLSAPVSQLTSGPAVVSAIDVPVISALSALSISPASAATPASAEITSTSVNRSANQRALAPPIQYVQVGEKAPKLSAKPSWQEVQRVSEVLLWNGTPFRPVDVVHHSNFQSFKILLQLRFATDPDRRDSCNNWRNWTNQNFCRELNLAIPVTATSRTDKLGFIETITQIQIQFDLNNPLVEEKTDQLLADIVDAFPEVSAAMQLTATKILIDKLPAEPINWRSVLYCTLDRMPRLITVDDFRFVWRAQLRKLREATMTQFTVCRRSPDLWRSFSPDQKL